MMFDTLMRRAEALEKKLSELEDNMRGDDWTLTIARANNGYIISFYGDTESDESIIKHREVFEDDVGSDSVIHEMDGINIDTDIPDGCISMYYLLHFIREHFGNYYSKHNKVNLVIQLEKQEDKNGQSPNCELDTYEKVQS